MRGTDAPPRRGDGTGGDMLTAIDVYRPHPEDFELQPFQDRVLEVVSLITKTFQATHCFDHIAFPQRL